MAGGEMLTFTTHGQSLGGKQGTRVTLQVPVAETDTAVPARFFLK